MFACNLVTAINTHTDQLIGVGIATSCGMDGLGSIPDSGRFLSYPQRSDQTQPPIQSFLGRTVHEPESELYLHAKGVAVNCLTTG
jgi:hypothetical protein